MLILDWVSDFNNWFSGNAALQTWLAASATALIAIGLPTVATVARTFANVSENKTYRAVTLVRLLWTASFLLSILAYVASCLTEDKTYNAALMKAERLSDVKAAASERSQVLEQRGVKLRELMDKAQQKQAEFGTVPQTKKDLKREAKAKKKEAKLEAEAE